jgi:hypothetical protein
VWRQTRGTKVSPNSEYSYITLKLSNVRANFGDLFFLTLNWWSPKNHMYQMYDFPSTINKPIFNKIVSVKFLSLNFNRAKFASLLPYVQVLKWRAQLRSARAGEVGPSSNKRKPQQRILRRPEKLFRRWSRRLLRRRTDRCGYTLMGSSICSILDMHARSSKPRNCEKSSFLHREFCLFSFKCLLKFER